MFLVIILVNSISYIHKLHPRAGKSIINYDNVQTIKATEKGLSETECGFVFGVFSLVQCFVSLLFGKYVIINNELLTAI